MVVKKKIVNTNSSEGSIKKESNNGSLWTEVSKHLMTGISYMIPVLIMGISRSFFSNYSLCILRFKS